MIDYGVAITEAKFAAAIATEHGFPEQGLLILVCSKPLGNQGLIQGLCHCLQ